MALVESGDFTLYRGDEPVADPEVIRAAFESELGNALRRLAAQALLANPA